jgi:hypothetical protein
MIQADDKARTLPMNPIADGERGIFIKAITLDGKQYTMFDAAKRMLVIPAGVGGEFKITFAPNQKGSAGK